MIEPQHDPTMSSTTTSSSSSMPLIRSSSSSPPPPLVPSKEPALSPLMGTKLVPSSTATTPLITQPTSSSPPKRRLPRFWQQQSPPPDIPPSSTQHHPRRQHTTAEQPPLSSSSSSSTSSATSNIGFGIRSFKRSTDDKQHTPKRSISLRRRRPSVTPTEQAPAANNTSDLITSTSSNNGSSLLSKSLPIAPPLPRRGSPPLSAHSASSGSSAPSTASSSSLLLDRLIAKKHSRCHAQQQQENRVVTVHECCTWIGGYCAKLDVNSDHVWKHIDAILESIEYVLVQTNAYKGLFRRRILELQQQHPQDGTVGNAQQVLRDIEMICNAITTSICCSDNSNNTDHTLAVIDTTDQFKLETTHRVLATKYSPMPDYTKIWPDHMDRSFGWFRRHFVGKPYTTFLRATDDETVIVSVVKDFQQSDACRVIIRSNIKKVRAP
ncbi:hypothetical protein BDB00DRAFT_217603 [Zychaea mexicana]|uniref:uncharacterized protein n=1 Tax=Zychaea mexicana TaxID=64656 RepID=UPI0022FF2CB3|nr:uncharacterized protein BDB00DRAFT_217603 [Zychaea mexicana]KAI9472874.1 hypothetical protein BDB00DRAFT_217603 [Zychaea mexicana]